MLIKNQIYEAEITDYTAEGQGVAHIEGCAVFIPNAVAGEKVRVRVEKAQKTWAAGKIVEILEKSPHRVNRECEVAKLCGGCDFWHMDYAEETRLKAERVKNCLNRIGGENLAEVPILAAPDCHGYRNKAQYPVAVKKGRAYAGFYRAGTHDVVENARCRILPEEIDAAKDAVIDYVNQHRVSVYDETTGKGLLRHIYVRRGAVSGQVLVCLAVNGEKIPRPEALVQRLNGIPGFTTLVLSVNTKRGNAVLGDRFLTLHGPGYIEDTLCGLNFRLSPRSFYQVNHHQAQRLYQMAISQAEITKADTVLDLYCGVGTITLAMAGAAGKVIGVEVVPQAVADARDNAVRNGITNAEFFCADAGTAGGCSSPLSGFNACVGCVVTSGCVGITTGGCAAGIIRIPRICVNSSRTQAPNIGWLWDSLPSQRSQSVVAPFRFICAKDAASLSLVRSLTARSPAPMENSCSKSIDVPKIPVSKRSSASYFSTRCFFVRSSPSPSASP